MLDTTQPTVPVPAHNPVHPLLRSQSTHPVLSNAPSDSSSEEISHESHSFESDESHSLESGEYHSSESHSVEVDISSESSSEEQNILNSTHLSA